MDFIGLFQKFAYRYTYINHLIDYFSRHMYLYPTSSAGTNNLIILFDYYLWANPKLYMVYINADLHFISQKLQTYF